MKYYAKIENAKTKSVSVGTGTNTAFYESIGMTEMDVEQGYDGEWYVAGYAPVKPQELIEAEALAQAKAERAAAVAAITVEVDGMTFDGDEVAQERMARTVTAATATGASMDDTTVWVLHDNTVATPTIRQLATALRMAGEAQTALWTKPYEA
jgi:biopolymer transport protein ExbD